MPIEVIWGNDINSCNAAIKELIDKNLSESWGELNLSKFNGNDPEQIIKAFEDIQSQPLGDGSRIVVLKNNPIFNNTKIDLSIQFDEKISNLPKNSLLILNSPNKPDSRLKITKFLNELIKKGEAKERSFKLPEIWDHDNLVKFVKETAESLEIQLDHETAIEIIDYVGNDSLKLFNELEKAKLYLAGRYENQKEFILKQEDVQKIFYELNSNIFKIVDYLLKENIPKSLQEINILLLQGEPALRLIAALITQIRLHAIVALLSNQSESSTSEICRLANISNPKRIFFIRKKIRNTSSKVLINMMIKLLNIEFWIKKGKKPINVFTENLIDLI